MWRVAVSATRTGTGDVLCFDTRETESTAVFFRNLVFVGVRGAIRVHNPVHSPLITIPCVRPFEIVVSAKATHTCPSPSTATLTFTMPSKCVTTSKFPITLWADVRAFPSVQFHMAFQVVKPTKSHRTCLANVRLFLTMGQEMTLEIVMSCELGFTIGALMFLL